MRTSNSECDTEYAQTCPVESAPSQRCNSSWTSSKYRIQRFGHMTCEDAYRRELAGGETIRFRCWFGVRRGLEPWGIAPPGPCDSQWAVRLLDFPIFSIMAIAAFRFTCSHECCSAIDVHTVLVSWIIVRRAHRNYPQGIVASLVYDLYMCPVVGFLSTRHDATSSPAYPSALFPVMNPAIATVPLVFWPRCTFNIADSPM